MRGTIVLLIDEVDLYLHPHWQQHILSDLQTAFPEIQFIVTTHSPHVIQTAEPNQIMALQLDENSNVILRTDLQTSEYGYKGWTVEEILYDVMGMKTLRTEIYHNLMKEFGIAVDEENEEKAKVIYTQLDKLLHPQNSHRKLLSFQLAKISEI